MKFKLVFWDWVGTLYCNDLLYKSRLKNLSSRGCLNSDIDFSALSFNEFLRIKQKFKDFRSMKVPFTWFLVHSFTKLGVAQVIISNGLESLILKELSDYNPFDLILTAERFNPKPDLSMVTYAMEHLNIQNKEEILLIGDSLIDKKVADNLGVEFFKITDYYQSAYSIAKQLDLI